jgi:transformation/transcription domain-associated protein
MFDGRSVVVGGRSPESTGLHGPQALSLLGKLGGRNRRFLHDPLELDLKENPEHGLRLILTFQPTTSFLVPLDRCLALSSQNLLAAPGGCPQLSYLPNFANMASFARLGFMPQGTKLLVAGSHCACKLAGKQSKHEKQQALRFLNICLASVLSLRSPDDSELPGSALDKMATMLFENQVSTSGV